MEVLLDYYPQVWHTLSPTSCSEALAFLHTLKIEG
jgi:hypothetical protein